MSPTFAVSIRLQTAEAVEPALVLWRHLLDRLSAVDRAGEVLLGMPSIAEGEAGGEIVLRWLGVHAPHPVAALAQVAAFLEQLESGPVSTRAVHLTAQVATEDAHGG